MTRVCRRWPLARAWQQAQVRAPCPGRQFSPRCPASGHAARETPPASLPFTQARRAMPSAIAAFLPPRRASRTSCACPRISPAHLQPVRDPRPAARCPARSPEPGGHRQRGLLPAGPPPPAVPGRARLPARARSHAERATQEVLALPIYGELAEASRPSWSRLSLPFIGPGAPGHGEHGEHGERVMVRVAVVGAGPGG